MTVQSPKKIFLSGSSNGKNIKVTGTATASSVVLHTAISGTNNFDEIFIYAVNTSSASVELTIEWGGATSPDDLIIAIVLPKEGLYLVVPGLILGNGNVVNAFAGSADVINLSGYVQRIELS